MTTGAGRGGIGASLEGRVATIRFENELQRNALTPEMLADASGRIEALGADGVARVIVLRGSGGMFSSGFAVDHFPQADELPEEDEIERFCAAIERSPLIVIAMIERFAIGAGLEVACACDLRLATEDTRLGLTPVKFGIVYSWQGTSRILNLVGRDATRYLFYTGELVAADSEIGRRLVTRVVPRTESLERATFDLADTLSQHAPIALAGAKQVIRAVTPPLVVGPQLARELHGLRKAALASEDATEAVSAFMEGRKPEFRGR